MTGSPPHRRWPVLVAACAALLLALGFALARAAPALVERLIADAALSAGAGPLDLEVQRVGPTHLEIRNLRLGAGEDVAIDHLVVRYTPWGLFQRRADEVAVRGVRIRAEIDEERRLAVGSLGPLGPGDGEAQGGAGSRRVSVAAVSVRSAHIEIASPIGAIDAHLDSDLRMPAEGERSLHSAFELRHQVVTLSGNLDAVLAGGALRGLARVESEDGRIRARLELEPPQSAGEGPAWAATRAGTLGDAAGLLELAVRDLSIPDWVSDIEVEGDLAFSVTHSGRSAWSPTGLRVQVAALGPALLERIAPGEGAEAVLSNPLDLDLSPSPRERPLVLVRELEGGLGATLEGEVRLAAARTGSLRLDVEGSAELSSESVSVRGRAGLSEILGPGGAPLAAPLDLEGSGKSGEAGIEFDLQLRGADTALAIEAAGSYDPTRSRGEAQVRLAPLRFEPGSLQPEDLLPSLRSRIASTSGTLEASGSLRWSEAGLDSPLDLTVEQISFELDGIRVEGVDAALHLDRIWPPASPPDQRVAIARIASGAELRDAVIHFQLRRDGRLALKQFAGSAFGGRIRTAGLLDPGAASQEIRLRVEGVDLSQLLEHVDIKGLSGSGTLEGEIPLVVEGSRVVIRGGVLAATASGGIISYRSAAPVLGGGDQRGAFVLAVLENFRYETLRATVNGEAAGESEFGIQLLGANPEVAGGDPVQLNLNYQLNSLTSLLQIDVGSRISESLRKRLR